METAIISENKSVSIKLVIKILLISLLVSFMAYSASELVNEFAQQRNESSKQKPQLQKNGNRTPEFVVGGKFAQEGVKKTVKYTFKYISEQRHVLQKIGKNSIVKEVNTIVDTRIVNLIKDVKKINTGLAQRTGQLFKLPNGNIYKAKSITKGANIYPFKGKGIYQLTRAEFKILQNHNRYGGFTNKFYKWFNSQKQFAKNPITKIELEKVIKIINSTK